jgi:hypothetical protein
MICISSISIKPSVGLPQAELLINGNLETGNLSPWNVSETGLNITIDNNEVKTGSYSVKGYLNTTEMRYFSQESPIAGGSSFLLEADLFDNSSDGSVSIFTYFYNSENGWFAGAGKSSDSTDDSGWQWKYFGFSAPAAAIKIRVEIRAEYSQGWDGDFEFWVDDIALDGTLPLTEFKTQFSFMMLGFLMLITIFFAFKRKISK